MEDFFALLHALIAVVLVLIILIQDPKGGSAGLFGGGGGANSLLGATGAPTLLARMTRYLGAAFAVTCIGLSMDGCQEGSVTDQVRPPLSSPSFPVEEAPTPAQEIPADAPQE